jgi:Uma2 family endonuclease
MNALARPIRMTPEDFVAGEREQPERYEFFDGEVLAMVGGTLAHSAIVDNMQAALRAALVGRGCRVLQSNTKVPVGPNYFYPDVLVACGRLDMRADFVAEQVLLAEVLSPSTQGYDRGAKWDTYRRLPSLKTFLLVEQERVLVHLYRRSGELWTFSAHDGMDEVIECAEPPVRLRIGDFYAGIEGLDPAVASPA